MPLVHGITVLHNNKCTITNDSTTGRRGLLGLSKKDLDKQLSMYAEQDFLFSSCGGTVGVETGLGKIKVWLHDSPSSTMVATPHLGYSMTTSKKDVSYGSGIEDELIHLAKECARYRDNWE